ncbi:4-diphosphocytidyl-2-C-methyl-D-erythritol kinase [Friedmanniella luteola]|uniref:4-diphosphocytidyl-2-C-methyl-D-erythritol kinase n=1 Tax=Friedmanniella luteola TaxID=546871 RepID=A0A1H1MXU7_9ACTN|nr:4-(cytidine 5'-diphospho)-2-C-methyl-D-erythritol kinase [Friedmanniella luteola]SDR91721.1 4-diphosphocytidyl-2-C-methyl-D-erythritol kinase [Friedmanniella luteola]
MASPLPPTPVGVRVRVPAKINLALKVGGRRPDGYHPLATVYHAVSLYDEVEAAWAEPDEFAVAVSGEGAAQVPLDDSNLALRAARLLARTHGPYDSLGAHLTIRKAIPVAAGLAGGSSNGAAALLACSVLWDLDVSSDGLRELAAELGSDVPFALLGGTALGSGRGEEVVPALARGTYHWVLAFGHHGLSTPAVYGRFDELTPDAGAPEVPDDLMNALRSGDPALLGAALSNDLQDAALDLQPRLRQVLEAGLEYGAVGAVVSGSGPTCAFLAANEAAAIDLTVALSADGVCREVRRVSGPVVGARVVA